MTSVTFLIWTPGIWELLIILVLALVLFGNRIPGVARSMGKGITEFKKGLEEDDGDAGAEQLPERTESSGREQ